MTTLDAIARTILYEGYSLYPYRESSLKNRRRVLFGTLFPSAWASVSDTGDAFEAAAECLLETPPASEDQVTVRVEARFLRFDGEEVCVALPSVSVAGLLAAEVEVAIASSLIGTLKASAVRLGPSAVRLRMAIANHTPAAFDLPRAGAEVYAFGAAHLVAQIEGDGGARFLSLTDPPAAFRTMAAECTQTGLWPVLVGKGAVLASPIILYDQPELAPESVAGDLFDATEIEEILALRVRTLTAAEKEELAKDPRTRDLLERVDRLTAGDLARVHGALRSPRRAAFDVGDAVVLEPRSRADAMDALLDGMTATVLSIEETLEGEQHYCVTIDRDPGRDLGARGFPGHRFFFRESDLARRPERASAGPSILIAGLGNVLMGDDGFGVEVARRLSLGASNDGKLDDVAVVDVGIRGFDLAFALSRAPELAILVDAAARGGAPGTLTVLEPLEVARGAVESMHGVHPVRALELARSLGGVPETIRIVTCEPKVLGTEDEPEMALSAEVAAAVPRAIAIVEELVAEHRARHRSGRDHA